MISGLQVKRDIAGEVIAITNSKGAIHRARWRKRARRQKNPRRYCLPLSAVDRMMEANEA
jgi:hypothetical protein